MPEFRLTPFPEAGIQAQPIPTRVWKIARSLQMPEFRLNPFQRPEYRLAHPNLSLEDN
jgi:hypothetical protein